MAYAPQSHAALGEKIDGKEVLNVYFLDNGCKMILVNQDTTAEQACQEIAKRIGFTPGEEDRLGSYMSLYESLDGALPNRPLNANENVLNAQNGCAKLIYMVKLFMDKAVTDEDPVLVNFMYLQAHHNIITGTYYCDSQTAIKLAAWLMQEKYGTYNPAVHKLGFISARLMEFIPATLMHLKKPNAWEDEIYQAHKILPTTADPKKAFLSEATTLAAYGCAFFPAKQYCLRNFPPRLLIGINAKGIWLIRTETRESLELFKLSEIYRWGFKPNTNFYFEVKAAGAGVKGPIYEFSTELGSRISELLTSYANALLEELGIRPRGGAKPPPPPGKKGKPPPPPGKPKPKGDQQPAKSKDAHAAAIQARYRGYVLRRDLEREYAAIQIAAIWRGYKERCRFDKLIEELEAQLLAEEEAAAGDA